MTVKIIQLRRSVSGFRSVWPWSLCLSLNYIPWQLFILKALLSCKCSAGYEGYKEAYILIIFAFMELNLDWDAHCSDRGDGDKGIDSGVGAVGTGGPLIFDGRGSCQGRLPGEVGTSVSLMVKDTSLGVGLPGSHHLLVILWVSYLTSLSLLPDF